jgi:hypothetical protein
VVKTEKPDPISRRRVLGAAALAAGGAALTADQAQAQVSGGGEWADGSQRLFVTDNGSDASNGRSPSIAGNSGPKRTIGGALTALDGPGSIDVGAGTFPPFTLSWDGVTIRGTARRPHRSTRIQAQNPTDTIIDIRAPDNTIENLTTEGAANFTGRHFSLFQASFCVLKEVEVFNPDETQPSAGFGGVAFRIEASEGCYMERLGFYRSQVGMHFSTEATEHVIVDVRGAINRRALVMNGNGGGNTFVHWKSTGADFPDDPPVVELNDSGDNIFLLFDADESNGNRMLIASHGNEFIQCVNAPHTAVTVTGDFNHFARWAALGGVTVTGSNNDFERIKGGWTINGSNNTVHNEGNAISGSGIRRLQYA